MSIDLQVPFSEFVWNLFHYRAVNVDYHVTKVNYDTTNTKEDSTNNLIVERNIKININQFLPSFIQSLMPFEVVVFSEVIIINFERKLLNIKLKSEHKDYFTLTELTIVKNGNINYTSNLESEYGSLVNYCGLSVYNQQRMKSLTTISKQLTDESKKYTEEDIVDYLKKI
jgi:hypothetical protein